MSSACLSLSVDYYLPACSLSRRSLLLLAVCRRPITTTAGPSGLVVDTLAAPVQLLLLSASTATACPSASLPCPAWLCWIAPAAPENPLSHHRIPTGTPAPRQSVSQSSHSQSHHDCLSLARPGSDFSTTTSPESSARAGPDISYLLSPHLLLARRRRRL